MFCRGLRSVSKRIGYFSSDRVLKRSLLTPSFQCAEAWRKRLNSPILKKCVLDDFFYELDAKYSQTETVNPIDVDVFVNAVRDSTHLDELQDLVHKLRLSRDSCDTLESTHHAVIRILLECEKYDDLMALLNDRLNYGIFPDHYSNILLFDTFLKLKDYKNAAKVACLQMLQEDFGSELSSYLSLYSCQLYLLNPTEWEKPVPPLEPEDDEEIKVRVAYLRNPYFDDHFDLTQPDHLIGKTLIFLGKQENSQISLSYELLGYVLFNKLPLAVLLMKSILGEEKKVHRDIFELIKKSLEEKKEKNQDKESPDLTAINVLLDCCQEVLSKQLFCDDPALQVVEEKIKFLIETCEQDLIKQQHTVYDRWIEKRDHLLKENLDQIKKNKRLAEVRRVKEQLVAREQELFFFDNEDELDLEIEKKEEYSRLQVSSDQKTADKKLHDYIPPGIVKLKNMKK